MRCVKRGRHLSVLEPAGHDRLTAVGGQRVPVITDLCLILSVRRQREQLVGPGMRVRATFQCLLALSGRHGFDQDSGEARPVGGPPIRGRIREQGTECGREGRRLSCRCHQAEIEGVAS
jgi:hypothetical protein